MLAARFPGEALPAVPAGLAQLTIQAALGSGAGPSLSTSVLTLTQGVLNAMFIHSLKKAALVLVSVAVVTGAIGFRAGWVPALFGADAGGRSRSPSTSRDQGRPPATPVPAWSAPVASQNSGQPFGQIQPS